MKILVVDDERVARARILACLKRWGHEAVGAGDGEEALRLFREQEIEFVITDWLMPKMDGLELLRQIRSNAREGGSLYAILLTSRAQKCDVVEGMEAGADDYIAKPFDEEELRVRVQAGMRVLELEHALRLQNRHLADANHVLTEANERMKESLLAAARIQQAFLPENLPDCPEACFRWLYEPCEVLAGDTLNVIPLSAHEVGIYIIDVSGHGVPAALLSVHLSRILTRLEGRDSVVRRPVTGNGGYEVTAPSEVATFLNQRFAFESETQQYFTALYGVLDLASRELRYTSAGHPGPLVISEGQGDLHAACPPAVGFLPDGRFTEHTVRCRPGDRLYFYTDGVFEVENGEGVEFGQDRVRQTLETSFRESLGDSLQTLRDTAKAWHGGRAFDDDLSLIGVELQ